MNPNWQSHIRKILRLEDYRAAHGQLPPGDRSEESRIHDNQVQAWDLRRGMALCTLAPERVPLSHVRAQIQRGNLADANARLRLLIEERADEIVSRAQLLFEEARIRSFEGDWPGAIQAVDRALELSPAPVTTLALRQIRANAQFEQGRFSAAEADLRMVDDLSELYPYATSVFYAQTLKIRIAARKVGPGAAARSLRDLLERHRRRVPLNLDILLTYCRVMLDIERLRGGETVDWATACYLIADALGDRLYAALALFDLSVSIHPPATRLADRYAEASVEFVRIRRMRDEFSGGPGNLSETVRTILDAGRRRAMKTTGTDTHPAPLTDAHWERVLAPDAFRKTLLVLPGEGALADLSGPRCHSLRPESIFLRAIMSVRDSSPTKAAFFQRVWKIRSYVPDLHDSVISTLLHRLRTELNIGLRQKDLHVQCDREILVLGDPANEIPSDSKSK